MSTNARGLESVNMNGAGKAAAVQAGSDQGIELRRVECILTESLMKRLLRKIFPDQRRHERLVVPPLVGYLGTMRATRPYELTDISLSGFCMLTDERWTPGTEMPVTLQRTSLPGIDDSECFTVQATVVRCGADGVGFSIVLCEDDSNAVYGNPLQVRWISKVEMELFLNRLKDATSPVEAGKSNEASASEGRKQGSSLSPAYQR